jgi:uncharacterized protein YbjT (DUF2867 family)
MSKRTAIVVGSTGAVGRQLLPLLVATPRFDKVVVLHHRETPYGNLPKVEVRIVDFAHLPPPREGEDIEAVFCAVGTTQNRAGSTAAFQAVDRDLPIAVARWAADNNATTFVGISSVDASAKARSVYLKTKGEMEAGVAGAGLRSTYLFRPSVLAGDRDEYRLVERIANRVLAVIEPVMIGPVRKYRAVNTKTVARAMLACAERATPGVHIVESDAVQDIGQNLGQGLGH